MEYKKYKEHINWIKSYGFDKAWCNNGKFWIADYHGHKNIEVTKRVLFWDYLPNLDFINNN